MRATATCCARWAPQRSTPRDPSARYGPLGYAFDQDYGNVGPIFKHVAATLAAYHVFPVVLAIAWFVRRARFGTDRVKL